MSEKSLKILVVEDEYITQKNICDHLIEIGYSILGTASNYNTAIEILNAKKVDLIILDIHLKGEKNGIELANYIKENNSEIPFIFLTAYSDTASIKEAIKTRPSGYLVKPFEKHDLFSAIEVALLNFEKKHNQKKKSLLVKHQGIFIKIDIDSIIYIESDKNYLIIQCINDSYRYRSTLTEIKESLPDNFIFTHKGFIINCNFVDSFSTTVVFLKNFRIPISKTYKDFVTKTLQE